MSISERQRKQLAEQGFVLLEGLVDDAWLGEQDDPDGAVEFRDWRTLLFFLLVLVLRDREAGDQENGEKSSHIN